jgi:hypothetical protein
LHKLYTGTMFRQSSGNPENFCASRRVVTSWS